MKPRTVGGGEGKTFNLGLDSSFSREKHVLDEILFYPRNFFSLPPANIALLCSDLNQDRRGKWNECFIRVEMKEAYSPVR